MANLRAGAAGRLMSIWPNGSLEETEGGTIALVEDDDTITIDIQNSSLEPEVTPEALDRRHANPHKKFGKHWVVARPRQRTISKALQAYAHIDCYQCLRSRDEQNLNGGACQSCRVLQPSFLCF